MDQLTSNKSASLSRSGASSPGRASLAGGEDQARLALPLEPRAILRPSVQDQQRPDALLVPPHELHAVGQTHPGVLRAEAGKLQGRVRHRLRLRGELHHHQGIVRGRTRPRGRDQHRESGAERATVLRSVPWRPPVAKRLMAGNGVESRKVTRFLDSRLESAAGPRG